jgi:DNA-binding protein Fis
MQIGNISFNLESLRGISKEDFVQHYRGSLDGADINEAYELIQKELNKTETKEEIKKAPKRK